MIRSMTGYGAVERASESRAVSVEVRSVNNRYLDVHVQLPGHLAALERDVRALVQQAADRGKVEVAIRIHDRIDTPEFQIDEAAVIAARKALSLIAHTAGVPDQPTIGDLLRFDGLLESKPEAVEVDDSAAVLDAAQAAIERWNETREVEGTATVQDISDKLMRMEDAARVFTDFAPRVETNVLDSIRERFREVLGDEADEQRIYAEAALLIVKYSTSEEMARLQSHVDRCHELLTGDGAIGKRLDFLCQEMNREINTIASKTIFAEVQDAVVEAKDAVDAIREQARNLE